MCLFVSLVTRVTARILRWHASVTLSPLASTACVLAHTFLPLADPGVEGTALEVEGIALEVEGIALGVEDIALEVEEDLSSRICLFPTLLQQWIVRLLCFCPWAPYAEVWATHGVLFCHTYLSEASLRLQGCRLGYRQQP